MVGFLHKNIYKKFILRYLVNIDLMVLYGKRTIFRGKIE